MIAAVALRQQSVAQGLLSSLEQRVGCAPCDIEGATCKMPFGMQQGAGSILPREGLSRLWLSEKWDSGPRDKLGSWRPLWCWRLAALLCWYLCATI